MLKKNASTSKIDESVAQSIDFELTVADMARRSEKRAWWVAGSAVTVSLVLLGGYFYVLPLKEKVPYLVMADAYMGRPLGCNGGRWSARCSRHFYRAF